MKIAQWVTIAAAVLFTSVPSFHTMAQQQGSVSAQQSGVAVGHDNINSPITTTILNAISDPSKTEDEILDRIHNGRYTDVEGAKSLMALGDSASAGDPGSRLVAIHSYNQAMKLLWNSDPRAALEAANKVLTLNPNDLDAKFSRALLGWNYYTLDVSNLLDQNFLALFSTGDDRYQILAAVKDNIEAVKRSFEYSQDLRSAYQVLAHDLDRLQSDELRVPSNSRVTYLKLGIYASSLCSADPYYIGDTKKKLYCSQVLHSFETLRHLSNSETVLTTSEAAAKLQLALIDQRADRLQQAADQIENGINDLKLVISRFQSNDDFQRMLLIFYTAKLKSQSLRNQDIEVVKADIDAELLHLQSLRPISLSAAMAVMDAQLTLASVLATHDGGVDALNRMHFVLEHFGEFAKAFGMPNGLVSVAKGEVLANASRIALHQGLFDEAKEDLLSSISALIPASQSDKSGVTARDLASVGATTLEYLDQHGSDENSVNPERIADILNNIPVTVEYDPKTRMEIASFYRSFSVFLSERHRFAAALTAEKHAIENYIALMSVVNRSEIWWDVGLAFEQAGHLLTTKEIHKESAALEAYRMAALCFRRTLNWANRPDHMIEIINLDRRIFEFDLYHGRSISTSQWRVVNRNLNTLRSIWIDKKSTDALNVLIFEERHWFKDLSDYGNYRDADRMFTIGLKDALGINPKSRSGPRQNEVLVMWYAEKALAYLQRSEYIPASRALSTALVVYEHNRDPHKFRFPASLWIPIPRLKAILSDIYVKFGTGSNDQASILALDAWHEQRNAPDNVKDSLTDHLSEFSKFSEVIFFKKTPIDWLLRRNFFEGRDHLFEEWMSIVSKSSEMTFRPMIAENG